MKFKNYTKEIAVHLDNKYTDLVENIYANDIAFDLSQGKEPHKTYLDRSGGINRYYRSNEKGKEIFEYVYNLMKC